MRFQFQLSNLLGTVYRGGPLHFLPGGHSLVSPVGNKLSIFDLHANTSETIDIEFRCDIRQVALCPTGLLLLVADADGRVHLVSLVSRSILHTMITNRDIGALSFSPDGRHFALAKEDAVFVYATPGPRTKEYSPFVMERVLKGARDDTLSITWSECSRIVAVGSRDGTTRLFAFDSIKNFSVYTLGGHTDAMVNAFFEKDSLNCYTLSENGHLLTWECSQGPEDMVRGQRGVAKRSRKQNKTKKDSSSDEDELTETLSEEKKQEALTQDANAGDGAREACFYYKRLARHFLRDHLPKEGRGQATLTAADLHPTTRLLVSAFSSGAFFIHEMPDANLLHSLSVSERQIGSVRFNPMGDWIAFGCPHLGQLLVWEWQSETFVLKQQGHFNNMSCVAYSPDGRYIVTGGEDGKVKVWNGASGFSFVTFEEHSSSVTAIAFTASAKVVLSASLDGTVRAFDMARYRNFRTLASPRPAQFSCLSVDSSGELVAAGGADVFEIYLWSMKTGQLLDVISAHEGPVAAVAFSPSPSSSLLASVSWDKTLRIWDALFVSSASEAVELGSDATAVAFRPDGRQVAVATLNGHITFFDAVTAAQVGSIEGRRDLGSGRADADLVTASKSRDGKCFLTLCYSADGTCVLAAGQSKHVCIYHVKEKLLVRKFEITQNRSLDAMDEVINRKKMTEFGNLALVEDRDDPLGSQAIKLPGARRGDLSARALRPEVRVAGIQFSPTGREFVAASTEGLLIYSLDTKLVFDPFELDEEVTPASIRSALGARDFSKALFTALRLNETDLVRVAFEKFPVRDIELFVADMPEKYVTRAVKFIGGELENTKHVHFYALWSRHLLLRHKKYFQSHSAGQLMPVMNQLHKALLKKSRDLTKISERNIHTMKFLLEMGACASRSQDQCDQMI